MGRAQAEQDIPGKRMQRDRMRRYGTGTVPYVWELPDKASAQKQGVWMPAPP